MYYYQSTIPGAHKPPLMVYSSLGNNHETIGPLLYCPAARHFKAIKRLAFSKPHF